MLQQTTREAMANLLWLNSTYTSGNPMERGKYIKWPPSDIPSLSPNHHFKIAKMPLSRLEPHSTNQCNRSTQDTVWAAKSSQPHYEQERGARKQGQYELPWLAQSLEAHPDNTSPCPLGLQKAFISGFTCQRYSASPITTTIRLHNTGQSYAGLEQSCFQQEFQSLGRARTCLAASGSGDGSLGRSSLGFAFLAWGQQREEPLSSWPFPILKSFVF